MSKAQGDTTTDFTAEAIPAGKYLVNPYEDWARGEGVPILGGRAIDLLAIETGDWPRFGCRGAIAHVDGRCDFLTVFLHEIAPGQATAPTRHVYDVLFVALGGTGETEIEMPGGERRIETWSAGTALAPPTNARYRHRNNGSTPARLAAFNDLRYLMNLYRSERFIFENDTFSSPLVGEVAARAGGQAAPESPGSMLLGSGTIGADIVERRAGVRSPAHHQMQGAHLLGIGGEGRTLSWREGAPAGSEIDTRWRHGVVIGLPGLHFHRHGTVGNEAARALDVQLGSSMFPLSRSRRHHYGDRSVHASGSAEIE